MAFSPQFLDEIRARVPLADAIGKRVKLQKRGREYVALCPFHNEKTPSFTVNEAKGFFHCFGCGAHGDVIGFVMRTEGLSFPEAVERLAQQAGLPVPRSSPEERARAEAAGTLYAANEAACAWFERQLRRPAGRAALDYLKGRGLGDDVIARFRLGYALDNRTGLKSALTRQGISEEIVAEAGLLIQLEDGRAAYDRFRGRIIFPITDPRGRTIAFGGRLIELAASGAAGGAGSGAKAPKYVNSSETPIFHKGRALYGFHLARGAARENGEIVVAEGYMDVIALHQAGFMGAVAPLGTALTEAQIELLWRLAKEPVLCFDGDEAGVRAAARAAERALPLLRPGNSLRFAMLPEGEDPDSLIRNRGSDSLRRLLERARPLVDLVWEMETANRPSDTPERRALIRKELRRRASEIRDGSVQDFYWDEFGARLDRAFGGRGGGWARGAGGRGGAARRRSGLGLRAAGDVEVLDLRQQQVLLAAVLNHPGLLAEIGEDFAELRFSARDLDRLRGAVIKTWVSSLDREALQGQLREQGMADVLDGILVRGVYGLAPFAHPSADLDAARRGWRHWFELYHDRRRLESEIDAARRALAEDSSARNWAHLEALKRQGGAVGDDGEARDQESGLFDT